MDLSEYAVEKRPGNTLICQWINPKLKYDIYTPVFPESCFCPMYCFLNPADTGQPKQANLHLVWLAVGTWPCFRKHLLLPGECRRRFHVRRAPWPWWQMDRVPAWHGWGCLIHGCCFKTCGRQSQSSFHNKINLLLGSVTQALPGALGELLLAAQPISATHCAMGLHQNPPIEEMSSGAENKTKQREVHHLFLKVN